MDLLEVFRENRELIKERFGVKKICVFGSSVGGEEKEESDVDVLVEFGRVKRPCDNFMELVFFLGELFEKRFT